MSLTASDKGSMEFEMTPEGVYTARCYRIIDLGTQTVVSMHGTKKKHQVMISWELIGKDDQKMQEGENGGKPFSAHKRYTLTLSEMGNLRPDLEAWRGKKFTLQELEGFDLNNVLGQYCTMQIIHSEDGKFANVQTIMKFKGEKPEPVNPDIIFDIDKPDMQIFESLSEKIKTKITSSPEWQQRQNVAKVFTPDEIIPDEDSDQPINLDDIPF